MTAPQQLSTTSINAVAFLTAWYLPITTPAAIGAKMWATGLPKPYRAVQRISGARTVDSDQPLIWVHTFGVTYSDAAREADRTDERFQMLVEYPGWNTVMADGRVAHCDWAEIVSAAHEEPYGAESVVTRFVSEYRLGISRVSAL